MYGQTTMSTAKCYSSITNTSSTTIQRYNSKCYSSKVYNRKWYYWEGFVITLQIDNVHITNSITGATRPSQIGNFIILHTSATWHNTQVLPDTNPELLPPDICPKCYHTLCHKPTKCYLQQTTVGIFSLNISTKCPISRYGVSNRHHTPITKLEIRWLH